MRTAINWQTRTRSNRIRSSRFHRWHLPLRRDATPSLRVLVTPVIIASAVCIALAGARDAEIAAAIKSRVEAKKTVGMVVATIEPDGSTSAAAFGNAGPGARPLDADSVFEIGSITKVFTAILLAEMADRGLVKLDDPVAMHLPADVRIPERNGRKITLLDLSTQSSGLPRMPGNFRPSNPLNPYADYTVAQMFDFLGRYQLTRDIGAEFEYSNLGVGLLGHALARRAGTSYEALVRERILNPLHMDHTGITLTPWMVEHLAKGHNASGVVTSNWDIPTFAGAGALRSTMTDMLKFARANLDPAGGRLQRIMQATHVVRRSAGRDDMSIGMNWVIRRLNGTEVVWHNGGTGGYRTWLGFDKSRKVAAVVLTNSMLPNDDLGFELVAGSSK
jgi:serine-type D-Ala-D-Ala carboxypeptidase/endopeptidase